MISRYPRGAAHTARAWSRTCSALVPLAIWAVALFGRATWESPAIGARAVCDLTMRSTHRPPIAPAFSSAGGLIISKAALPIENVAMTKGCMLLRYQIYILTSCEFVDDLQMGISIDFWESWICTIASRNFCSPPATLLSSPWYRCFCILAHGLGCGRA